MNNDIPKEQKSAVLDEEDKTMQRARELSARRHLTPHSMDKLRASVPDDWKPGEANVDEFLSSIRGRGDHR